MWVCTINGNIFRTIQTYRECHVERQQLAALYRRQAAGWWYVEGQNWPIFSDCEMMTYCWTNIGMA